jgi:NAD(P)-dependent dehydrogenase (short-subunit alcohol dehydrogenase family)
MTIQVKEKASLCAPALRMLLRKDGSSIGSFYVDDDIGKKLQSKKTFNGCGGLFSNYRQGTRRGALWIEAAQEMDAQYKNIEIALEYYRKNEKCIPALIALQNTGLFAFAATKAGADTVLHDFLCVVNGQKVPASRREHTDRDDGCGRAGGKIVVITGSAQGFGKGIAETLALQGAYLIVADINETTAKACADELCRARGEGRAVAVKTDVTQENSIKNLMIETVLAYGGIDVFISNAGILRAGSLEEMDSVTFDLVTKVNYSAFFLGTKYASQYMKIQHRFDKEYYADIIQINSKSGLEGSNRNFAYAGGKFGSIGLTQSFALELVDYNIKVNAICPGNYFEGPLWSDPAGGLFAQYLRTNKVPGAKTVEDVKRFYENKVPMKRGCSVRDVALAVLYLIEQNYETGQALPVTGGQVMLR